MTTVSASFSHADLNTHELTIVMGKLRAAVRPLHGEIEEIVSDPHGAITSKAMGDYAADEERSAGGEPFLLNIGGGGIHEKVAFCENKFKRLVPMCNAMQAAGGKHERHAHHAYFMAEWVDNTVHVHANKDQPALTIFLEAASPPRGAPATPMVPYAALCAYVLHPEQVNSKWEDHAKPGWYAGPARSGGPWDASLAKVITQANRAIGADWGMIKILDGPVMERLEVANNPKFADAMPDKSVPVSMHPSTASSATAPPAPAPAAAPSDADAASAAAHAPAAHAHPVSPPPAMTSPPPTVPSPSPTLPISDNDDKDGDMEDESEDVARIVEVTDEHQAEMNEADDDDELQEGGEANELVTREEFDEALQTIGASDDGEYDGSVVLSRAVSTGVRGLAKHDVETMIAIMHKRANQLKRPVRATQPPVRLNPSTTAPQSKATATEERKTAQRKLVMVPAHIYPDYECAENNGVGWTAEIVRSTPKAAVLQWLHWQGENGAKAETVALNPAVLLPFPPLTRHRRQPSSLPASTRTPQQSRSQRLRPWWSNRRLRPLRTLRRPRCMP